MSLSTVCGQLVLGGFAGSTLPAPYERALQSGRRCGAVLFGGNVSGGIDSVASLCRQVHAAAEHPLLAIDQEGGRVARLRAPFLELPSMRSIALSNDAAFAERMAAAVGSELAALGITINFAPVLDVDTRADNPIIGDRAFGSDATACERFGLAWIRGLQSTGVLATAKHFPGHGDTSKDSHLELPAVDQPRDRLERVELAPFRAAVGAGVAAMMTAHVVYPALDANHPATLSRAICTDLRDRIGFAGVLVSDDLEMQAIAAQWQGGDAAVLSVAAGCDVALVCHSFDAQEAAHEALVREAERSAAFRERCVQASRRVSSARARATARPLDAGGLREAVGGERSRLAAHELEAKLAR